MKADPSRQARLLDLAGLDTRSSQLAHRRANLPETKRHAELAAELEEVHTDLVRARTAHDDVQREISKAEADVQLVRDRAARNQSRLDAGQGSAKDLQALQHELVSLARRQAELEDVELEVVERAEGLGERAEALAARHEKVAATVAEAATARDAALGTIATEEEQVADERRTVVTEIGDDLLALYEKIRAQTGVGAAELNQRRCEGCRLELLGADLRRIAAAAADDVVRCEECRRILVRTDASGL